MAAAPPQTGGVAEDRAAKGRPKKGYQREIFPRTEDRDRFSCGLCALILRDPVQADCGHRFCDNCRKTVEESSRAGQTILCRFCIEEGSPQEESKLIPDKMRPDRGILREMSSIVAKCPNDLCIYSRPFKEYVKHEEDCKFQPLVCDKCGEYVSKQKMEKHGSEDCPQRVISCEHCHKEMAFGNAANHAMECTRVPKRCTMCSRLIPQEKMKRHQSSDCPMRLVLCPLEECAPIKKQPLSVYKQHVQKELPKHLSWVLAWVGHLEDSVAQLTQSTPSPSPSPPRVSQDDPAPGVGEVVDSLRERVAALEHQVEQRLRATAGGGGGDGGGGGGGGGDTPSVTSGAPDASASLSRRSEEKRIHSLEMKVNSLEPLLGVLYGEVNRCVDFVNSIMDSLQQQSARMLSTQHSVARCEQLITNISSSLTDQETLMHQLEERVLSSGQTEPDGTLLWRIPNFSKVRIQALSGECISLSSPPFYTGPLGYKLAACLYPNGDGEGTGTHLSVFVSILPGPHDPLLPWPFRQTLHLMVLDQSCTTHVASRVTPGDGDASFHRPSTERNQLCGLATFMPLSKLHQPGLDYLRGDTLFVRVVVDTQGLGDHVKQFMVSAL